MKTRAEFADEITRRLEHAEDHLKEQWNSSSIRHFVCEDLLPSEVAEEIHSVFPDPSSMMLKKSLKELKYVGVQMNKYDPLLEEITYAFQDQRVVDLIARITGLGELNPDANLYAGGVSLMAKGHYLNPHLDNSHDHDRMRYRVLNLLYYVTPDWDDRSGGNLELWPEGPRGIRISIPSRFNRLVAMVTDEYSWHSVSKVSVQRNRCCVSNYYFSPKPAGNREYLHVTSFRGRPEQLLRDYYLRADIAVRQFVWRVVPKRFLKNPHVYDKSAKPK